MKQIFTAATVDEAKNKAAVEFGTEVEKITFTVLEEPKKGFFGKIKGEAKVEAEYEPETKVETVTEKTEAVEEKAEVQEEVKAEAEWSDTLQKKADCYDRGQSIWRECVHWTYLRRCAEGRWIYFCTDWRTSHDRRFCESPGYRSSGV